MKTNRLLLSGAILAALTACSGGGVDLNVSTVDNSVNNTTTGGGGQTNPCASYTVTGSNEVRRGSYDGRNCVYSAQFVGDANPLTQDVTIPLLSGGVHIFQDSLVVGRNVASGAAPASGTGPKLTIEAGNTLAFSDSSDYVLINRGSQIIANGSPSAPITLTSFTDAVSNTAGANDVSQWGGIVINGNGITNNCTDAQRTSNACHVVSEGRPSNYGGNNNADNSGTLRYVIVKHTGFEVAPGDELNGITFNAVGSGTVVENVQVYSTFDDGFEFFGGAVNLRNAIALYVRDDSLDFSDGYVGTIENALVIQWQTDGNRCIELDNIGQARVDRQENPETAPITAATVRNMTCIVSAQPAGTHGAAEGSIARLGGRLVLANSVIYSGYGILANPEATPPGNRNRCYRLDGTQSLAAAAAGNSQVDNTIVACSTPTSGTVAGTDTVLSWLQGAGSYTFNTGNSVFTDPNNAATRLFETVDGRPSFYTLPIAQLRTSAGATIAFPAPAPTQIGAVTRAADWTSPWAFGLRTANADRALWFAP